MRNFGQTHRGAWRRKVWVGAMATLTAAVLSACGGGGDGDSDSSAGSGSDNATATIQGTASVGGFLANAEVILYDGSGAIVDRGPTDANGKFAFTITKQPAPFSLVVHSAGHDDLFAAIASKPAPGETVVVNATPLTTAMTALLVGGPPSSVVSATLIRSPLAGVTFTPKDQQAMVGLLRTVLSQIITGAGLDPKTYDPLSTPLSAEGQGADSIVDQVGVKLTSHGATLFTHGLDLSNGATAASVLLTHDSLANPPTTALPAPAAKADSASLEAIRAKLQACFALTPDHRTQNGQQPINACSFFASYLNNGFTAVLDTSLGLVFGDITGARFQPPVVVYYETNAQSEQTALVRFPYVLPDNTTGHLSRFITLRSNTWTLTGNERTFETSIGRRVSKVIEFQPVAGSTVSRYETALRVLVNPGWADGLKIQAARVTGPGLPADGVVLARSTACGSGSEMAIQNTDGLLRYAATDPVAPNMTITTTRNTASTLVLAATPVTSTDSLTWSALSGGSNRYATTPLTTEQIEAIPPFAQYKLEVWYLDSGGGYQAVLSSTPDATYTLRDSGAVAAPSALTDQNWNDIDRASQDFVDRTSALATEQSNVTVNWTQNAETVDRVGAFEMVATQPLPTRYSSTVAPVFHTSRSMVVSAALGAGAIGGCTQTVFPSLLQSGAQRSIEVRSTTADDTQKFTRVVGR